MNLRAAHIIDSEIQGHYAFFSFVDQLTTELHKHDFYEIFLVTEGNLYHHINGQRLLLDEGSLVFIRPDDAHFYEPNGDQHCELINLAFLRGTLSALTAFLCLTTDDPLLVAGLPPMAVLTAAERTDLQAQLVGWGRSMTTDKFRACQQLRTLLAHIIMDYFIVRAEKFASDAPSWLIEVCQQMQRKTHVIEGRAALMRLAGRSPEYVGRAFKAYLGVTPSQFINDLRLDYAGDLLLNTDHSVTDICYEVGFENLSHFYRLFKQRWTCTPQQYRKQNRRTLIP